MVSKLVRENLTRRAARFNLLLDDVSITHVTFSPAFSDAVEAKQIAQQTAQRAAYLVDQVKSFLSLDRSISLLTLFIFSW
jgi:prohibitin 2